MGKTLFEKIWDEHVIVEREDGDVLLYIDRHLTHDLHFRTFGALKAAGLSIKEPDKLFGVPDHSVPTTAKVVDDIPPGEMREAVEVLAAAADEMGFVHYDMTDDRHTTFTRNLCQMMGRLARRHDRSDKRQNRMPVGIVERLCVGED